MVTYYVTLGDKSFNFRSWKKASIFLRENPLSRYSVIHDFSRIR